MEFISVSHSHTYTIVNSILGDKMYFMGPRPTDVDVDVYAFLVFFFDSGAQWAPAAPTLYPVLAAFVERMRKLLQTLENSKR